MEKFKIEVKPFSDFTVKNYMYIYSIRQSDKKCLNKLGVKNKVNGEQYNNKSNMERMTTRVCYCLLGVFGFCCTKLM